MNLLLISENPSRLYVRGIEEQLKENGHQVHPPYDIYDKDYHIYSVPSFELDRKRYISTTAIIKAIKTNKEFYFKQLLALKGKEKIDAALFYNPNNQKQIKEEHWIQILSVLEKDIPIYLYQDNPMIKNMALSVEKDDLVHTINQDVNQIKPHEVKVNKQMIKRRK